MTDIFISYSHKDELWKDALERHLKVLELHGEFAIWDDRQIEVGSSWLPAIETALEKARVALLLVSSDFLTSEFITRKEVPRFLQRREAEGLQIVPVIVKPCAWRTVPWLAALQGATKDNRPLSQYPLDSHESEQVLSDITDKVYQLLQAAKTPNSSEPRLDPIPLVKPQSFKQDLPILQSPPQHSNLAQGQPNSEKGNSKWLWGSLGVVALTSVVVWGVQSKTQQPAPSSLPDVAKVPTQDKVNEPANSVTPLPEPPKVETTPASKTSSSLAPQPPIQQPVIEPAKPTIPLPEMIPIQGGTFTMGCKDGRDDVEGGCGSDEKPPHSVTVSDFALSRTEITRGQFRAFVEATGYQTTVEKQGSCWGDKTGKGDWGYLEGNHWQKVGFEQTDDHPVVCISWNDAQAYVQWLNEVDDVGKNYRLPTEAEWEYVARGQSKNAYPWGQDSSEKLACQIANLADQTLKNHHPSWQLSFANCEDGYTYTAPVGQFSSDSYGLLDIHGNVWEWTQDCYHDNYDKAPKDGSAWETGSCEQRIVRGGGWCCGPQVLRSAYRKGYYPLGPDDSVGFRVSKTY